MRKLARYWYYPTLHVVTLFLLPLSWLFAAIVAMRRKLYRAGVLKVHRFPVPVIVVGNITVGGTGKTPLVIWLALFLRSQGYTPGIVSRGVGGKKHKKPYWVSASDAAATVGDEALLLLKRTACPMVIGINRAAVTRELLAHSNCNIVIGDDGLQHYALHRDIEIAVVDGARRCGNQKLLPAGPLRESVLRLDEVDFVVVNGGDEQDEFNMSLVYTHLISLKYEQCYALPDFPYKNVHAIAGIGHPERFFTLLTEAGFSITPHAFPDHYLYQSHDFTGLSPVIMTEKDAVKCSAFAGAHYWYLPVTAKMNIRFQEKLLEKLKQREACDESTPHFSEPIDNITDSI